MILLYLGLLAVCQATLLRKGLESDFNFQEINYLKQNLKDEKAKLAQVKDEQNEIGDDLDETIAKELKDLDDRHDKERAKLDQEQQKETDNLEELIKEQIKGVNEEFEVSNAELENREKRIRVLEKELRQEYRTAYEQAKTETEVKKHDLDEIEEYQSYLADQLNTLHDDEDEGRHRRGSDEDNSDSRKYNDS